jgi:integration host factor subunit beta
MTKHDLMEEVAQHFPHLSPQEVKAAVDTVFAALTQALAAGKRIELRGFGSFELKHHQARAGHNPRTGAAIAVPAKIVPFFRVAQALRRRVEGTVAPAKGDGEEKKDKQGERRQKAGEAAGVADYEPPYQGARRCSWSVRSLLE